MWGAIIPILVNLFGVVMDAIMKECIEEDLTDAAAELPPPDTYASEGAAAEALFDEALARTPRWRLRKRKALRRMKAAAVQDGMLRTAPLTEAEVREGWMLAGGVKAEW